ncbi:LAMI_0A00144g1_1 [Lachancea mirantina]|uniref:LAMI_0A00144g1_1 n=1 Tax=Lachancea mirantina TaxID=1230905 RepID=A0A1G4ILL1_9SACH|nr:LAMI_0A00144g1_1 [Lachancea mirantina]
MAVQKSRTQSKRPLRKKACTACSKAKVRCDLKRKACSRCVERGIENGCHYPLSVDQDVNSTTPVLDDAINSNTVESQQGIGQEPGLDYQVAVNTPRPCPLLQSENDEPVTESSPQHLIKVDNLVNKLDSPKNRGYSPESKDETEELNFKNVKLVCTVSYKNIENRWLNTYLLPADQKRKSYPPNVTIFISRMLKAYCTMPIQRDVFPPFVHSCQVSPSTLPTALAICLSLMRLFDRRMAAQNFVIQDTLDREMARLFQGYSSCDEVDLLASFQAYLIYSMTLYFELKHRDHDGMHEVIMNLQVMACELARRGLTCPAELSCSRPDWESWIMAEAKRRSIFTMYLFDSLLSAESGQPTFLATELQGTLAPSGQTLWQATTRDAWTICYNQYLYEWGVDGPLLIDELWSSPPGLTTLEQKARNHRVDRWLSDLDNYGAMLFAVTACTHSS